MSVNMEVTEKPEDEKVEFSEVQVPTPNDSVAQEPTGEPTGEGEAGGPERPLLVDVPIVNESTALNVLVGFLNVAQRRGAFNFKESGKISECINMFVKGNN